MFKDGFTNEINLGFQLSHHSNQCPGFFNASPTGVPQPPLCPHMLKCPSRQLSIAGELCQKGPLCNPLKATFLKFPSFQVLPSSWWPQRYLGMVTTCTPTSSSHGVMTGVYQEQWEASEARVAEKNGLKAWMWGWVQVAGKNVAMARTQAVKLRWTWGRALEGTGEGPWGEAMSGWCPQFPGLFACSHGTPDENSWLKTRKAFWELQAAHTDMHDSLVSWSGCNRISGARQAQDNRIVKGHSSGGQKSGST